MPVNTHPAIVETQPAALHWPDEAATQAFAQRLAACPALGNAFIALHGDLGAGKTTFTRHLLRALGVAGRIKSPTYAVVEPHEVTQGPHAGLAIWHFDFYRFNNPQEWEDAGFRDLFASPGLKLAEWPDKAAGVLPEPDLALHLSVADDDSRHVRLHAASAAGRALQAVGLQGAGLLQPAGSHGAGRHTPSLQASVPQASVPQASVPQASAPQTGALQAEALQTPPVAGPARAASDPVQTGLPSKTAPQA